MVEFAVTILLLLTVIFGCFEFDRMLMVYTSVANAARVGVRYAIVHGSDNPATDVADVVKDWAKIGFLNPDNLDVAVTGAGGTPGTPVTVTVQYPYDPLTFIPLGVTLSSTSQGVIVF